MREAAIFTQNGEKILKKTFLSRDSQIWKKYLTGGQQMHKVVLSFVPYQYLVGA
jgi:hypothetical protein